MANFFRVPTPEEEAQNQREICTYLKTEAQMLIEQAHRCGYKITIELKSDYPPCVGEHTEVIDLRPLRSLTRPA